MTTVQFPREPDDALYEYLAEKARVCGGGADDIWEGLCARFGLQPAAEPEAFNNWLHQVVAVDWGLNGVCTKTQRMQRLSVSEVEAAQKAWTARGALMVLPAPGKYDETLLPFLALMRNELHANSHKGDREGWLRMTLEQALDEIQRHADKLFVPVMNHDREAIREHAADVANCAMMLADIAGVLSRE